ncbi:MAG: TlpA family protein disulfide reductase, partial [Candidatus Wallbacteria bacterium]|nr:TlpA family protein disulfide reductase [Candidatus Wallbacteria bacterium]
QSACTFGPVLLAFFKVGCPTCQLVFPYIEKLHRALGEAGLTVLGVSQDDAEATVAFATEKGCTFRMLLDGEGYPASKAYGVAHVPSLFLIGKDGQVWETIVGWSKDAMNSMAGTAAGMVGAKPVVVCAAEDAAPPWKPG